MNFRGVSSNQQPEDLGDFTNNNVVGWKGVWLMEMEHDGKSSL